MQSSSVCPLFSCVCISLSRVRLRLTSQPCRPVIESVMDGDQKMLLRLSWNGTVPLHLFFFFPCPDLPFGPVRWFSEDQEILTDVCINRKCNASSLRLLLGSEGIRWPPASCLLSSEKCVTALLCWRGCGASVMV